jgi:hypothetical protein
MHKNKSTGHHKGRMPIPYYRHSPLFKNRTHRKSANTFSEYAETFLIPHIRTEKVQTLFLNMLKPF